MSAVDDVNSEFTFYIRSLLSHCITILHFLLLTVCWAGKASF